MKTKLLFIFAIFLIGIVSASPLSDFMSDDVTKLNITISQNQSSSEFYINTSGYYWDEQSFEYEDIRISGIFLSDLLKSFDFKANLISGNNYILFENVHIQEDSVIYFLINNLLVYLDLDFRVIDINSNNEYLTNYSKKNPISDINTTFTIEKSGNNYRTFIGMGYGDVEEEYKKYIREVIEIGFYSISLKKIVLDYMIPDIEVDFLDELDYEISLINLDNVKFEDEIYNIVIQIKNRSNGEIVNKTIALKLEGIINKETEKINDTYIPKQIEVNNTIEKIEGLGNNTISVHITKNIDMEVKKPSNSKALNYLNITLQNQINQTAYLTFKVPKSDVGNYSRVDLYVWEITSWNKLKTTYLSQDAENYKYQAEIPHFSLFLIAEDTYTAPSTTTSERKKTEKKTTIIETIDDVVCKEGELSCMKILNDFVLLKCIKNKWEKIEDCPYGCSENKCKDEVIEEEETEEGVVFSIVKMMVFVLVALAGIVVLLIIVKKSRPKEKKEEEEKWN